MANVITSFLQEHYRFLGFWVTNNVMSIAPEQLLFTPAPGKNHIYWLFGHMTTHMDMSPTLLPGAQSSLPPEYRRLFHKGSRPDPAGTGYPAFEDMVSEFRRLSKVAVKTIGQLSDEDLPHKPELEWKDEELARMFPDKAAILRGNLVHMAYHNGQISYLKAMQAQ